MRARARGLRAHARLLVLAAVLLAARPARAQDEGALAPPSGPATGEPAYPSVPMHAEVFPSHPDPTLGQSLRYRGWVVVQPWQGVRWSAPDRSGDLVWGPVRTGRARLTRRPRMDAPWPADSVWVEAPLQIFRLGIVRVPGLAFRLEGGGTGVREGQLPVVPVRVQGVVPAGDSNATLRPPRGPLAAPWWETVPWVWIVVGLIALAGIVWLVVRLRRRKPRVAPASAPVVAKRRDPGAEALTELAALRRLDLPRQGRYAEHAFQLGRILRRYLEATVHVPRPGDTTPELVRSLKSGGFSAEDLQRLTVILRRWDGIKFARLDSDADEAHRSEEVVRDLVVSRARGVRQEVA